MLYRIYNKDKKDKFYKIRLLHWGKKNKKEEEQNILNQNHIENLKKIEDDAQKAKEKEIKKYQEEMKKLESQTKNKKGKTFKTYKKRPGK